MIVRKGLGLLNLVGPSAACPSGSNFIGNGGYTGICVDTSGNETATLDATPDNITAALQTLGLPNTTADEETAAALVRSSSQATSSTIPGTDVQSLTTIQPVGPAPVVPVIGPISTLLSTAFPVTPVTCPDGQMLAPDGVTCLIDSVGVETTQQSIAPSSSIVASQTGQQSVGSGIVTTAVTPTSTSSSFFDDSLFGIPVWLLITAGIGAFLLLEDK